MQLNRRASHEGNAEQANQERARAEGSQGSDTKPVAAVSKNSGGGAFSSLLTTVLRQGKQGSSQSTVLEGPPTSADTVHGGRSQGTSSSPGVSSEPLPSSPIAESSPPSSSTSVRSSLLLRRASSKVLNQDVSSPEAKAAASPDSHDVLAGGKLETHKLFHGDAGKKSNDENSVGGHVAEGAKEASPNKAAEQRRVAAEDVQRAFVYWTHTVDALSDSNPSSSVAPLRMQNAEKLLKKLRKTLSKEPKRRLTTKWSGVCGRAEELATLIAAEEGETSNVYRTYVDMCDLLSSIAHARWEREKARAMEAQKLASDAKNETDKAYRRADKQAEKAAAIAERSRKKQDEVCDAWLCHKCVCMKCKSTVCMKCKST